MLDREGIREDLALQNAWWMWRHPRIESVLAEVRLQHWVAKVGSALERNRRRGVLPAAMRDLHETCFLNRDAKNVRRLLRGHHGFTNQTLLGMAVSLKVPIAELIPTQVEWVAQAVAELSDGKVHGDDALALANYCCRKELKDTFAVPRRFLDEVLLAELAKEQPAPTGVEQIRKTLLRTGGILGQALERISNELLR